MQQLVNKRRERLSPRREREERDRERGERRHKQEGEKLYVLHHRRSEKRGEGQIQVQNGKVI